VLTAGAAAFGIAMAAPASADAVSDFYEGKTVTVMVPSSLGATLGLYARLVVDHIGRHVPGKPNVIIASKPGAGGTVGAAYAYNVAPKDGTYISEVLAPSVIVPLLREMKFDGSKFQWLGSVAQRPAVVSLWKDLTPGKSLADARKMQIILGSTGKGSETYIIPAMMNALLGTKFKIVLGYKGGAEVNQAMEQGEIHGRQQYWSGWTAGKPTWLRDKKLIHLVQYGPRIKELADVPTLRSLVSDPRQKKMIAFMETANLIGIGFWVPPGVPGDRLSALRRAFSSMVRDQAFLASAKKLKAPIDPISGTELQKIVADAYDTPTDLIAEVKKITGAK
jgi:tripartite-type tricarboxylate transporter receptor subunit TctC